MKQWPVFQICPLADAGTGDLTGEGHFFSTNLTKIVNADLVTKKIKLINTFFKLISCGEFNQHH
jgi:hypothetical protein